MNDVARQALTRMFLQMTCVSFVLFSASNCWIDEVEYENGTARCAGAIKNDFFARYDTFINVQGDMPDVTTDMVDKCIIRFAILSCKHSVYNDARRKTKRS